MLKKFSMDTITYLVKVERVCSRNANHGKQLNSNYIKNAKY